MKQHLAILLAISLTLTACGPIDTLKEGFSHAEAVSAQLEKSFGSKPFVGFNWNNGTLTNVNITFNGVPPNAPLNDIVAKAKQTVVAEFKQAPKQVIVSFAITP
ncbi:MAG: hypothetical protein JO142_15590 [Burkholderiales bacterium]|nr:hypothetical protein [Burkholderiales bacterium]